MNDRISERLSAKRKERLKKNHREGDRSLRKKRDTGVWIESAEQEYLDPLFFFLLFLLCFFVSTGEPGWKIVLAALVWVFFCKGRQTLRNRRFLQKGRTIRQAEADALPLCLREMLFWQGVVVANGVLSSGGRERTALIIDNDFFPDQHKVHRVRDLAKELEKKGIPMIFFADVDPELASVLLRNTGISDEDRAVITAEQFACFMGEQLARQAETIYCYTGLDEKQKRKVLRCWQRMGRRVLFVTNHCPGASTVRRRQQDRPWSSGQEGEYPPVLYAGPLSKEDGKDIYFMEHWTAGVRRLLRAEKIWDACETCIRNVQEKVLFALCVFNGMMLFGILSGQEAAGFHWMFLPTALVCGILAVWKETYRCWVCRRG